MTNDSRSSPQPSAVPAPLAPDGEASALLAAARAAKEVPVWVTAAAWERHGFLPYMATYLAACSPERIIALLTTLTARTAALAEARAEASKYEAAEAALETSRAAALREAAVKYLAAKDVYFDTPNGAVSRVGDPSPLLQWRAADEALRAALASASPEPTTEPTDARRNR